MLLKYVGQLIFILLYIIVMTRAWKTVVRIVEEKFNWRIYKYEISGH